MITESYTLKPPFHRIILVYFGYAVLMLIGHIRTFLSFIFYRKKLLQSDNGYPTLLRDFEHFYRRHLYTRTSDCFNRPITSAPGPHITILDRETTDGINFSFTGTKTTAINLSSYNYLGFAGDNSPYCSTKAINDLFRYGTTTGLLGIGTAIPSINKELEGRVAQFVGHEAAMIIAQGFATNEAIIPSFVNSSTLLLSDNLNHSSIVAGCKRSKGIVRKFKHNDINDLKFHLEEALIHGNNGQPWSKIIVLVEGIYSMEGELVPLKEIVELKKTLPFYLYVDEAHSIGAIGRTGKGVCEYWGVDPKEVDILMGTFTKSFGSVGGYVSGSKSLIDYLKRSSEASMCTSHMSAPSVRQVLCVLDILEGKVIEEPPEERLFKLRENTRFFRRKLRSIGLEALGDLDSPVIPILLYHCAKIPAFSRECLKRGLAVVVVGFPATEILLSRVRFCVSAAHSKEDLELALEVINEVADITNTRYLKKKYVNHAKFLLESERSGSFN
ncbi:hypothetical protein GEMRC1_001587 [Eukaryota sp. GEM-RC1]